MNGASIQVVEEYVIILLIIALAVAIVARRLRMPYTAGLVLIGLVITFFSNGDFEISPEIILALLVPPLVFEAAFHIHIEDLRHDFWLIILLAIPGVILTTVMVGLLVSWGTGLAIPIALVFGALVSATDPVAVVALFRRIGAPRRLQVLLEGESLFNDGTAIVMFGLMLTIAIDGKFSLATSIAQFVRIAGGGVLVGIILGMLVSQISGKIDEALIETTFTLVLAFGSYLLAESLHVSGVLAVVTAGIVNGNVNPSGMSPTTRIVVFNFWETAAFLANSFIFLLVGIAIDQRLLIENWQAIGWAILAALLARVVSIYGFSLLGRGIPTKWKHILFWGGMRGAITLALALGLPETGIFASERGSLQAMAFGLVLFTLLVQGFSMDWLFKRIKISERSEAQNEYERRHARLIAGRASYDYLRRRSQEGLISEHTWQKLSFIMEKQNESLTGALKEVMTSDPTVEAEELDTAHRESLRAQRAALTGLLRDSVISEENFSQLVGEVDAALTEENLNWSVVLSTGNMTTPPITRLTIAVIQQQDFENASNALTKLGFTITQLPSAGGFLNRNNVMILIGLPAGREAALVRALNTSCKKRIEYSSTALHGPAGQILPTTPITVGGATIFVFEVESYEEF
jgi:Na+:H+ antiporter